ncbi:MAG: hypothetical protein AB1782_08890 [Cyanobacteriota bacterium]
MNNIYSIPTNPIPPSYLNTKQGPAYSVFQDFERKMVLPTKSALFNEEIKKGRKRNVLIKTGIVTASLGILLSLASRRVRFNVAKFLEVIRNSSENVIKQATQNKNASLTTRIKTGVLTGFYKVSDSMINFLGNLDHFKNHLTGQVVDSIPGVSNGLRFINGKLTPFYTGTVRKAAVGNYRAADKAAIKFKETVNDLCMRNPELRKILGSSADDLFATIKNLSGSKEFAARHKEMQELLDVAVKEYTANFNSLKQAAKAAGSVFDSTISLDLAKSKLLSHHLKLLDARRVVTFSHNEQLSVIDDLVKTMLKTRKYTPDAALLAKIGNARAAFAKMPNAANRKELINILDDVVAKVDHPKIIKAIAETKATIAVTRSGEVQRLAKRLQVAYEKGHINKETYKELSKQLKTIHNKTAEAVRFEKENLSGRLLDIAIGPVPLLETASLAIPSVALAHEVAQSENKKERISKTLVFGPTILGGVGATIYALQKGIFGANALLYGAVTGYIFNRLGKFVDDKYYSKGKEFNTLKLLSSDQIVNSGINITEV